MTPSHPLQPVSEWDPRLPRMLVVSLVGHVLVIALVVLLTPLAAPRPMPMIAYTVEITDPSALGGRTPPGAPGKQLTGGATVPAPAGGTPKPEPEAKAEPAPAPVKPPEPKPEPAAVKVPTPKAEAKPEPKPEPKPRPVPPKPEARPEPVAKVEPPKPVAKPEPRPEPKAEAKAETKKAEPAKPEATAAAKPAATPRPEPAGRAGGQAAGESPPQDAYGAAAERWRQKSTGGGGLGGQDSGSGPIGAGGDGKGGGGQLVGIEFLAYRQQVINAVKGAWANVLTRPGLVAKVRFEIAADGTVSGIRLEQGSGNPAYDASALRAVQRANPLPPPPARYAGEFRDFVIEFHSEETGGQGTG